MRFIDRDGDTWETVGDGMVRVIMSDTDSYVGTQMLQRDAEEAYGPFQRVREGAPDDVRAAVRAELAVVLAEMATEAYDEYQWREGVDADVCYRVYALFEGKAKALRAAEVGE